MKPHLHRTNPYNKLAELHNKGIDYVYRKLKERQLHAEEIEFETILDIVSEYIARIQGDRSKLGIANNYAVIANLCNMDRDAIIDQMLEQQKVPREVIGYLENLRHLPDSLHSSDLIRQISVVEKELLASSYSNDEIKYVLLYIAIAKGSIRDWQQHAELRFPEADDRGWPWKEDAESAVLAAVVAPVDFFLTGGVLTGVSMIGGSVASSSWAAIKRKRK